MITSFTGRYRFLSNFYATPVFYDGIVYPSSEHAYQAAKSLNPTVRLHIKKQTSPGLAKRAGKKIGLRQDWERVKLRVMEKILRDKFRPDDELAKRLVATKDEELIEGNWWDDTYWGVCNGVGENHLGKLLMKLRSELVNCDLQLVSNRI